MHIYQSYNELFFQLFYNRLSTIIKLDAVNYGGVSAIVVMKFLMVLIGARYNADGT
jgi:hypothetical protein